MLVVDELKQHLQSITLTLTDFIEALARVADMTSMPTTDDLLKFGAKDAFEYFQMVAIADGVSTCSHNSYSVRDSDLWTWHRAHAEGFVRG